MKNTLLRSCTVLLFFVCSMPVFGQTTGPNLGAASGFSVYSSAGAISNIGHTFLCGDMGTPAGAITGFPPGAYCGSLHAADALSNQAAIDIVTAYNYIQGQPCNLITSTPGNGQTLFPGAYCIGSAVSLGGELILDGQNNPNSVFIFNIGGVLNTGENSKVTLINSASPSNVFWGVGGAVNIGANSFFTGTIIANGAMSMGASAILTGRILAMNAAISLNANTVKNVAKVSVSAKVFLQGASTSNGMSTTLNTSGLIPLSQPYNLAPFNHVSNMLENNVLIIPISTTDWVLVELLDNMNTVVDSRAAFVTSDGTLIDVDGSPGVCFSIQSGNYNLGIRHRNHLAVRTAIPINFVVGLNPTVDFTTMANGNVYTNPNITTNAPMAVLDGGKYAMWGGDANGDGKTNYVGLNNDEVYLSSSILKGKTTSIIGVYHSADLNLNGNIEYIGNQNDETLIFTTVLGSTTMPKLQHY